MHRLDYRRAALNRFGMAWFLGTLLISASMARGAAPVEGDRDLLLTLRDAQIANQSLFPRGEMHVTVENRPVKVRVRSKIVWDGTRTFWEYVLVEPNTPSKPGARQVSWREEKGLLIDDGQTRMFYWPAPKFAQIIPDKSASCRDELKVRVSDIWYTIERSSLWSSLLDPDRDLKPGRKFVVRSEPPDRVVVENWDPSGGMLKIVASLAHDGNIMEYETGKVATNSDGSAGLWRRGKYDWERTDGGKWRLSRYEYQWSSTGDRNNLDNDFLLVVDSFDPNPVIAPDRFAFSSLQVPDGTTVEEKGSKRRTYRVGEEDRRVMIQQLDALSEKLRGFRFARPRPEKR